jgi:hypothetical protein
MAIKINALERQPTNLDYARPTQFRFDILKIPNTAYHVQECNLPGIAFSGDAIFNTRFKALPMIGDTLNYEPLELTFIVQENLQNYMEIHNWMTGAGFPYSNQQASDAIREGESEKSTQGRVAALTSDATLTLFTNKNNPLIEITFTNMYPTSLSALQFDTKDTEATQLTATVTMNYHIYSFKNLTV